MIVFVLSTEAMEERYEHKTHAHIQDLVRLFGVSLLCTPELILIERNFILKQIH